MNPDKLNRLRSSIKEKKMEKKEKKGHGTDNVRFIFGKDMTPEEMLDAVIRIAKKHGISLKDNRKEHGIPIVDSRKKMTKEQRAQWDRENED